MTGALPTIPPTLPARSPLLPGLLAVWLLSFPGCQSKPSSDTSYFQGNEAKSPRADSLTAVRRFTDDMAKLLLDTHLYEMRGTLVVKEINPDSQDESPLIDRIIEGGSPPGPHVQDGKLYADLEVLRGLLRPGKPIVVEGDRVFVGNPPVLILGHLHGQALFVPVKLFARQFHAYVDQSGTLGTMATIWPREIMDHMRRLGFNLSTGMVEAYAEGLVDSLDGKNRPSGGAR